MELLKEAFIIYYGKEYREYITKKFENLKIFVAITPQSKQSIEVVLDDISYQISSRMYNSLDKKYKYNPMSGRDMLINSIVKESIYDILLKDSKAHEKVIYSILKNKFLFIPESDMEELVNILLKDIESVFCENKEFYGDMCELLNYFNENGIIKDFLDGTIKLSKSSRKTLINNLPKSAIGVRTINPHTDSVLIMFSLFSCSEHAVIHEINHALVGTFLALKDNGFVAKDGISVQEKTQMTYEELLNDISACEILQIFHNIGGSLDVFNIFNYQEGSYRHYFPLINKFYNIFKDIIKKARISEDKNLLYSELNRDPFLEYEKYIQELLDKLYPNEDVSFEQIAKANELVDEMAKKPQVDLREYLTQVKQYIESLKEQGKVVKTFDDNMDRLEKEYEQMEEDKHFR